MKKRLSSFILVLVLVLGMIPAITSGAQAYTTPVIGAAHSDRGNTLNVNSSGNYEIFMVDGYLITSCYTADPEERYDRYWAYAEDHALVGTGSITHYAMPIGKDEMGILMSAGGLSGGQLLRIPFADLDSPEVLLDFQDERVS